MSIPIKQTIFNPSSPLVDPKGPLSRLEHVNRGGSWFSSNSIRCTNRNSNSPLYSNFDLGFRLVRSAS